MLAAHADRENLVAAHHAAAQAKPLNHGVKGYGARTPGNMAPKTPFKVPLNDENGATKPAKAFPKFGGKGVENEPAPTGKKDNSAFVTPAGPRTRAPLGMKTTNAKAQAFATPAPQTVEPGSEKTGVKSSGPRLRRAKVKVHQASPAVDLAQDEERDIEYMPLPEVPLLDDPEDWPSDLKYPQFEGKNLVRGLYSTYFDPVDDDGLSRSDMRDAERNAKISARNEALMQKSLEETLGPLTEEERDALGFVPVPKPAPKSKPTATRPTSAASGAKPTTTTMRRPLSAAAKPKLSALCSRSVASALSATDNPTASVRAQSRSRSALSTISAPSTAAVPRKKDTATSTAPTPSNPTAMRQQAATAASRTTLGYGKGRAVSNSLRKPLFPSVSAHNRAASQPSNLHSRIPSATAGTRPTAPARSRSQWSRHDSDATLVAGGSQQQEQDENEDEELVMMRELQIRTLSLSDDLDGDDWFTTATTGRLGAGIEEDEEEEFRFTLPEI